jgi:hypothetical protein
MSISTLLKSRSEFNQNLNLHCNSIDTQYVMTDDLLTINMETKNMNTTQLNATDIKCTNLQTSTINGGGFLTNPATSDINMSGHSILNADDIKCLNMDTSTINGGGFVSNPALSDINMSGHSISNADDIKCLNLETSTINGGSFVANPATSDINMSGHSILNADDIKCLNVDTSTINGGGFVANPATSDINMAFNNINAVASIDTQEIISGADLTITASNSLYLGAINDLIYLNSSIDGKNNDIIYINNFGANTTNTQNLQSGTINPLIFNSDLDMKTHNISDAGIITASELKTDTIGSISDQAISVNRTLNLNGFHNINSANLVDTYELYAGTTITNNILSDLGEINISGDFKGDNKANIYDIKTLRAQDIFINSMTKNILEENIQVNSELNMTGNDIINVGNLGASSLNGLTPMYNASIANLDMKNYNINNVNMLNTGTLQSNVGGTPIIINETLTTKSILPGVGSYNIGSDTDPYENITANALFTTAVSAFPGYTEVIINNDLNLDNFKKIKKAFSVETKYLDARVTGTTIEVLSDLNLSSKNITNVNNLNTTTLGSTTINNSGNLTTDGTLRAGTILQDTSISCYAQYTQTLSTVLAVPLTPTNLVVIFNTSLSPFNVTTSTPTFNTFTILHAGLYRCVFSLNGEMSADREMVLYFRKNNTPIRTMYLSRTGTRNVEISFNELIDFVINDAVSISVQALDATFNFTMRSATFNIEKIRKNNL